MEIGRYSKQDIEDCKFLLSPSSLHTWFENPYVWYKNNILKDNSFVANTNTVFGNIAHAIAESFSTGNDLSKSDIENYVYSFRDKDVVIDEWYIFDNILDLKNKLTEHLQNSENRTKCEYKTLFSPSRDIYIGGTIDYYTDKCIGDYKTVGSIPSKIKTEHLYQLVTYAICEIENGNDIDFVEITYISRPNIKGNVSEKTGKIIGIKETQIKTYRETLTPKLIQTVKQDLKVLIKCVKTYLNDTSMADVLFRDNKLSFMREHDGQD